MNARLEVRIKDWDKAKFVELLHKVGNILVGSVAQKDPKLPPLSGKEDALEVLLKELQSGIFIESTRAMGGSVGDFTEHVKTIYDRNQWENENGTLLIRTGVPALDNVIGGIKRQELSTIMGYVGGRKTTLLRTINYNAAAAGFRVLHIPVESTFDEELVFYSMIHAHAQKARFGEQTISKTAFDRGCLKPEEKEFFFSTSQDDFRERLGDRLVIRQLARRTWADVRNIIEMEHRIAPIDVVSIDYLALLDTPGERDRTEAINNLFKIVKAFSLTFDMGHGIAFITPVQGSRDGFKRAAENEGAWDPAGIYMYSEAEKSSDTVMYVYSDDALSAMGAAKVGTCKSRRSGNAIATITAVHPLCGYMTGYTGAGASGGQTETKFTRPDDKDDV
jgi:hypothetical protein